MNTEIIKLKESIAEVRSQIVAHPLYGSIQSPEDARIFSEYHVFPVWDFMSLLKALQRGLTCVEVPWVPVGSANTRYLINEIVVGEESDVDENGKRVSHYELYLRAMEQLGADMGPIKSFVENVCKQPVREVINEAELPEAVKDFLRFTFGVIATGKVHEIAAVFTFGREDLIPDMFMKMVCRLDERFPGTVSIFKYYLERHIEVDGDHHSILSMEMVKDLCGDDAVKWREAGEAAKRGLEARLALWDFIFEEMKGLKSSISENNFAVSS